MNPNDPNNPNNQFRGFGQYAPPFPNNPSNQQNRPFLNFPYGFPDPNSNPGFGFSQQTGSQFTESQFTGFAQLLANNPAPGLGFGFSQPETVPETQPETVPERDVGSSQRARKSKKKSRSVGGCRGGGTNGWKIPHTLVAFRKRMSCKSVDGTFGGQRYR